MGKEELIITRTIALEAVSELVGSHNQLEAENTSLRGEINDLEFDYIALAEENQKSKKSYTRLSQVSRKFNIPRARILAILGKDNSTPNPNLEITDEQIAYLKGYIKATGEVNDSAIVSDSPITFKPFMTKEELKGQLDSYFNIGL